MSPRRKSSPKQPNAAAARKFFALIQGHRRQQRNVMAGGAINLDESAAGEILDRLQAEGNIRRAADRGRLLLIKIVASLLFSREIRLSQPLELAVYGGVGRGCMTL